MSGYDITLDIPHREGAEASRVYKSDIGYSICRGDRLAQYIVCLNVAYEFAPTVGSLRFTYPHAQ